MKRLLLLACLCISLDAFPYITIILDRDQVGTSGWAHVTENFSTDGPGNCIFELICSDPGNMTCAFTVLKPDNTPGCVSIVVRNGSGGTGSAYNDVCKLVDEQVASGKVSGIIVPPDISVVQDGTAEPAVITYSESVTTGNTKRIITVYAYSEAHALGLI